MTANPALPPHPQVGILVLNYHYPEETVACVMSLLQGEPETTRVFWIENDAARTGESLLARLKTAPFPWQVLDPMVDTVPPAGTVGVILCADNLGYAAGNNVGLRFLQRHDIPYGWVLNNDTLLMAGCSTDLIKASKARPEVGIWGVTIRTDHSQPYMGGLIKTRNFAFDLVPSARGLEDPLAFVSGCSMFMPMASAAKVGFLPEDYFLYYEDPSFSLQMKQAGMAISGLESVEILHLESLSTGRRSPLMDFYGNRNRWFFIQRFFPEHLARQKRRNWYTFQKYLLRGQFLTLYVHACAYWDYLRGRLGRTSRTFSNRGNR